MDLIKQVHQFGQLPNKCGHCSSEDLMLEHRTAGDSAEYDYLHLKCRECGAKADLGQTKNPKGGIFFKYQPKGKIEVKNGFYKYWEQPDHPRKSSGSAAPGNYSAASTTVATEEEDDIPF